MIDDAIKAKYIGLVEQGLNAGLAAKECGFSLRAFQAHAARDTLFKLAIIDARYVAEKARLAR